MSHLDYLKENLIAWRETGGSDLAEGMRLVANYEYPEFGAEKLQEQLDVLYQEAQSLYQPVDEPKEQIHQLNRIFFGALRFAGATQNFHLPEQGLINRVLVRRSGNPISLCVLYMLIARRLSLPLYGVNTPNIFVLIYKTETVQFYINVFNKGQIFQKADIELYIGRLALPPSGEYYQPCDHFAVLQRVMRNLYLAYGRQGEEQKQEEIRELYNAAFPPEDKSGAV
jgi:regulator of sirC expression with transglutaminase-like and TPR domain